MMTNSPSFTIVCILMLTLVGSGISFTTLIIAGPRRINTWTRSTGIASTPPGSGNQLDTSKASRIFFDIAVNEEPIGRLKFLIPSGDACLLPRHTENLLELTKKSRTSIEPLCSYVRCTFQYSPQFIEGRPQYRWAHVMKGKGKNAVGRSNELIKEEDGVLQGCTHAIYGGIYYGINYNDISLGEDNGVVLLTVPINGPGRGSTSFSIVRVSESPQEWKERLLLNSAVLGWMESTASFEALRTMARQLQGPPEIIDSGVLEDDVM